MAVRHARVFPRLRHVARRTPYSPKGGVIHTDIDTHTDMGAHKDTDVDMDMDMRHLVLSEGVARQQRAAVLHGEADEAQRALEVERLLRRVSHDHLPDAARLDGDGVVGRE